MTTQHDKPESLRFDEAKSFTENCEAFLASIKAVDSEMAAILRDNWDSLVAVVRNGDRDSKARSEFNAAIAKALDALATPDPAKGGE
jgi:hypothetical protein